MDATFDANHPAVEVYLSSVATITTADSWLNSVSDSSLSAGGSVSERSFGIALHKCAPRTVPRLRLAGSRQHVKPSWGLQTEPGLPEGHPNSETTIFC